MRVSSGRRKFVRLGRPPEPAERASFLPAAKELLECRERFRADMVFDSLGVGACGFGCDSESGQKGDDRFVPRFGAGSEVASGVGQENGAVGLGGDEAGFLEALDGADDGDVSNAEGFGQIGGASFALCRDEIGDGFDVVLGAFFGVLEAGLAVESGRGGGGFGAGALTERHKTVLHKRGRLTTASFNR